MKKNWEDNFNELLDWLDKNRERAGEKYEEIRRSLIAFFYLQGFAEVEDLADEAISRVIGKVPDLIADYEGDPAAYFHGVARRLAFEASRKQRAYVEVENPDRIEDQHSQEIPLFSDETYDCLEKCLERLSGSDRELILLYYQQDLPKIGYRRELAKKLGLDLNALRVKVHRIRAVLHRCIDECVDNRHGS